jgi:hypothetical protein
MKLDNLVKSLLAALLMLVATGAFASNKGTMHVQEAVQVNGQSLAPGEYQLRWEGTGSNVELSFMQGKKQIAKTSAKVIELDKASPFDSAVVDHSSGKAAVSEVRFAGKKTALTIGAGDRAAMAEGSTK